MKDINPFKPKRFVTWAVWLMAQSFRAAPPKCKSYFAPTALCSKVNDLQQTKFQTRTDNKTSDAVLKCHTKVLPERRAKKGETFIVFPIRGYRHCDHWHVIN